MPKFTLLLTMLANLTSFQGKPDVDCTPTFDSVYGQNELLTAFKDVNEFKHLEYVFQNHRHFYYTTITAVDRLPDGVKISPKFRVVITFEFRGRDIQSGIVSHDCHIFSDQL